MLTVQVVLNRVPTANISIIKYFLTLQSIYTTVTEQQYIMFFLWHISPRFTELIWIQSVKTPPRYSTLFKPHLHRSKCQTFRSKCYMLISASGVCRTLVHTVPISVFYWDGFYLIIGHKIISKKEHFKLLFWCLYYSISHTYKHFESLFIMIVTM